MTSEIFSYIPVRSPIHSLDPRTKMTIAVTLVIAAVSILEYSVLESLVLLAVVIALFFVARIPRDVMYSFVKLLVPLGVILFIVQVLVFPVIITPGEVTHLMFTLIPVGIPFVGGWGEIYHEGIVYAFVTLMKFLVIMLSFYLFLVTTPIDSFLLALRKMRFPYTWAFLLTAVFRYLPVLSVEFKTVSEAQISRGLNLTGGGIIKRAKSFLRVLGPVFVNSIMRSEDIALALESRALDFKRVGTQRKVLKPHLSDAVSLVLCVVLLVIALMAHFGLV